MKTEALPELTQQPIEHVDATPDAFYPIRILRAYRANCNSRWETHGLSEDKSRVYDMMNEHCEQRAKILDEAIKTLEENVAHSKG